MLPQLTWSDKKIESLPSIDIKEMKETTAEQFLEEDFNLYLQNNLPSSHNKKFSQDSDFKKYYGFLLSDIVSAKSPNWCNQHFDDN